MRISFTKSVPFCIMERVLTGHKEAILKLLMGNEAIALGAIRAGSILCGYPGTPSTEVLETVAET